MGDTEPDTGWTKPRQSFKLKKNLSRGRPGSTSSVGNRTLPNFSTQQVKRRNPFGIDDSDPGSAGDVAKAKRQRLGDIFSPASAFRERKISFSKVGSDFGTGDSRDSGLSELSQSSIESSTFKSPTFSPPTGPHTSSSSCPPLDWSLKSRARFTSPTPLGWTQHLSTVEEASGVTGGVRCLSLSQGSHCLDTSANAQFHSLCLYWQHPSLPVPLYPRYTLSSLTRPATTTAPSLSLSPEMQRAMHSDWMSSLQSVYQLVKARQCPYFYLLAPSFTCLFRAAGIAGSQQITSLLTPSTTGIRAALKREEIEFTLPLFRPKDPVEEEDASPECDSTNEFLESLGIEADSLPGLANAAPKNRLAAGSSQNIDGKVESLVMVEGVECQSLLNYLLNAKLVVGKDQLPPTLLAPVAYHGASLRTLRVKQGQTGGKGGVPLQHSVELTGPILPHMVQGLSRLAATTTNSFGVGLNTLEETNSFSLYHSKDAEAPSAFATASLDDCGLDPEILKTFCALSKEGGSEGGDTIVRDLLYSRGSYQANSQSKISL
eukprot:GFUD01012165.1.p1 GENE.GFUD01012165.1~~GFUD01012165.1.p1  ORF type:complete len:545 (-),score=169.58 GFUD01012165.1:260-1894(-)